MALSFVMLALFMRSAPASDVYWRINLGHTAFGRLISAPGLLLACRTLAVALFLLVVAAGLFGIQSPLKNIAPVMVWAIWWVGMAYISALLGNLWALVNPQKGGTRQMKRIVPGIRNSHIWKHNMQPAALTLGSFVAMLLASGAGTHWW